MKVSLDWLKEYVDLDLNPQELAERLDLTGTAVESIDYVGEGFDKVVVGEVKEIKPHPKANKLLLCRVSTGNNTAQIVCGARNVKKGDKVPVALPGADLPTGLEIKRSNIRGKTSEGMLCAEDELGLGENHTGILILDKDAPVGKRIDEVLNLRDCVLNLEITPNRPDCLGMIGVAREVAAVLGTRFRAPKPKFKEEEERASALAKVEIRDAELCPRYVARIIDAAKIGPSPLWMRQRLEKAGIRLINNVVDVTNYVMLETGQPLHAFDYDKLEGGKIIVRRAKKGEDLLTLDEVDRQLDASMLVIADSKKPVALAGVMGGAATEISSVAKTILLESASFKPQSIMRTSRNLGLLSESSARFEKGVDPNGADYAAARAAQLIARLTSGEILKGAVDVYPKKIKSRRLVLRSQKANGVLGTDISKAQMTKVLKSLGLKVSGNDEGRPPAGEAGRTKDERISVSVPTFRPDLEREIDLIEEIGRLHGLNKIESTLPESSEKFGGLDTRQWIEKRIKETLLSCGLWEIINYGFIDPAHFEKLRLRDTCSLRETIQIRNPLTEDQSAMRTTLIPGLLQVIALNNARGEQKVQIFEMGRVFRPRKQSLLPDEIVMVTGALTGTWRAKQWYEEERTIDFFDAKGVAEVLLEQLGIGNYRWQRAANPWSHPGRCAEVVRGKKVLGVVGELHPETQAAYELKTPVAIFDLKAEELISAACFSYQYEEIIKFPPVSLDIALVVDEGVACCEVAEVIRKAAGSLLCDVHLFDVYRGDQVPKDKKSLAYSLTYRAQHRTLELEEVQKIQDKVVQALEKKLGAEVRS